jgi:hypothetical protein
MPRLSSQCISRMLESGIVRFSRSMERVLVIVNFIAISASVEHIILVKDLWRL